VRDAVAALPSVEKDSVRVNKKLVSFSVKEERDLEKTVKEAQEKIQLMKYKVTKTKYHGMPQT
jgi:hypothetical protein